MNHSRVQVYPGVKVEPLLDPSDSGVLASIRLLDASKKFASLSHPDLARLSFRVGLVRLIRVGRSYKESPAEFAESPESARGLA